MKVISVTGGKGGIGKTTISINLAIELAKTKKVVLFDADLGLANVDVLLGLRAKCTIGDYLDGKCSFEEMVITGPYGLRIIPSDSGVQKYSELQTEESAEIIRSFSKLTGDIDYLIVDLAAGISKQVIDFANASQNILVVICNDPASLMDSYAVIKILYQRYKRNKFGIIVNKVKHQAEGYEVFCKFQEAVMKFIDISINYIGSIPEDESIKLAAQSRVAVVDKYLDSKAALAISDICKAVSTWENDLDIMGGIQFLFERILTQKTLLENMS